MKRPNKGAQPEIKGQPPAEVVEKSPPAKGNCIQTTVISTQRLKEASIGLSRVRESAKRDLTQINVFASDLRQEPSAVVPHAWDLYGGRRATGIPTVYY
jgi:hypothetical protein